MKRFGVDGFGEEVMEEEIGIPLHALLDGDNKFSDLGDLQQQLDIVGGMALSVGGMAFMTGGGAAAARGAYRRGQYYRYRHKVNAADSAAQEIFGEQGWQQWKDRIDNSTNEDMKFVLADIVRSKDTMGKLEMKAAMDYAKNLMVFRGYNLASTMQMDAREMTNEPVTPEEEREQAVDDAYSEGHDAEGEETHGIQTEYEDRRKELADRIGISEQQLSAMSDEELQSLKGQDEGLDRAVNDYQLSKAKYQGVVDNANDEVDMAAQRAASMTDMITDRSRGTVRTATIKATQGAADYDVYILNGNIATNDDGSINISDSDKMIIYYDPQTGKVEHADASRFAALGEERPAEEVKAKNVADAKEQAIKEVSGIIDGRVEAGSKFTVTDEDGTQHTYEVLNDNGDGTAVVSVDGNAEDKPYSLQDLQDMKDLEDRKRLEAAKAERAEMEARREKKRAERQKQDEERREQRNRTVAEVTNADGNVVMAAVEGMEDEDTYIVGEYNNKKTGVKKYKIVTLNEDGTVSRTRFVDASKVSIIDTVTADEYRKALDIDDSSVEEDDRGGQEEEKGIATNPTSTSYDADEPESAAAPNDSESKDTNKPSNDKEKGTTLTFEDGSPVPVDDEGIADPKQMTARQAAEYYDNTYQDDAEQIINDEVADSKKALDKAQRMKIKGKNNKEMLASRDDKRKAVAEAVVRHDAATAVRDAYRERMIAKEEDTPEGRRDLIEKAKRKFNRLKGEVKDSAQAVAKLYQDTVGSLLHRLYDGTGVDVFDDVPATVDEYVASSVAPYSLNYEGGENAKGVQQETGLSRADFAKRGWLAAEGKGKTVDAIVHSLWENRPSNLESADTQEIRDALIRLITGDQTAFELKNYIQNQRIAQAEAALEDMKRREEEAREDSEGVNANENDNTNSENGVNAETNANGDTAADSETGTASEETAAGQEKEDGKEQSKEGTDDKPFGEQIPKKDIPFDAKDNAEQETAEERAANVAKNRVEEKDMDLVDAVIGKKMRKSLERIAKMMGAKIQYQYTDKKGNGWYDAETNTIYLTLDSSLTKGVQFIFGHEMTHEIKRTNAEAYEELAKLVKDSITDYDKAVDEMTKRYSGSGLSGYDRAYYEEEVVADGIGYMLQDLNYAHTLAMKMSHPLLAKLHEIVNRIRMAFAGTEYTETAKQIMRSIEQAYVKTANGTFEDSSTTGERFSLKDEEKVKRIEKLRESKPVEITGNEVTPSEDLKQYKRNALEYGKSLRSSYTNKDTGVSVQLGKTGVKEVLNHDYKNVEQLQSVAAIPQIIENAIYIGSEENTDPEKNKDVSQYHYYACGLKIGGNDYTVRAVVAEQPNGNRYYDHKLSNVEKNKFLDSLFGTTPEFNQGTTSESNFKQTEGEPNTSDVSLNGKDKKLISILQTNRQENDGNEKNSERPKFSLRVYHGSGADFTEFDFDHMSEGAGSQAFGWGGYVTSSKEIGKSYATLMDNDTTQRGYRIRQANAERFLKKYPTLEDFLADERVVKLDKSEEEKIAYYNNALKNAEPYHNLYEVDIPDDKDKNYLDWDAPLTDEQKNAIVKALKRLKIDFADLEKHGFSLNGSFGDNVYEYLYNALKNTKNWNSENRHRSVSKFLSSLGYTGIKYKAGRNFGGAEEGDTNYVIFKPEDMKIAEHTKFSLKNDEQGAKFDNQGNPLNDDGTLRLDKIKAVAEPSTRFSLKDEKTMFGMHNISLDKLRKAIKQGGFAAPSMGVIDSKNGIYSDYGEITLIPKAEKLAKSKGKNAGTFTADAWTPVYPKVEKIMTKQGEKAFRADLNKLYDDIDVSIWSNIKDSWGAYFSNGSIGDIRDGLYFQFLQEKGLKPEVVYQNGKYDKSVFEKVKNIVGDFNKVEFSDSEISDLLKLMNEVTGKDNSVEGQRKSLEAEKKDAEKKGNPLVIGLINRRLAKLDDEEDYYMAYGFMRDVAKDHSRNGKVKISDSVHAAKDRVVESKKLSSEFDAWLDKKSQEYDAQEMLCNGTTPSGKPKYIPNTVENAVKLMKKQGLAGGYNVFHPGVGAFIAKLSPLANTLSAMKKAKDKLIPFGDERHNEMRDKIVKEYRELARDLQIGESAFDDSGEERMQELADLKPSDLKGYIKKNWDKEVSDEWVERYNDLVNTIKNDYPVYYFETKFMRPYGLDEFEKAIVPKNTPKDVVDALKKAGIDVRTYEGKEDREKVTMDAINSSDDIKFSLKQEKERIVENAKFSLRVDLYEHDLAQWKKDNNLPKEAEAPKVPFRRQNESASDFMKRVKEYRKQMALWKTAPKYEQHLLASDTAQGQFNLELQRSSVLARIALQDSMLAIRKAQEAIMKEVGVDRLNMAEDAYTAENRSHGKGKNEFEEYNDEFLQPLRKAYNKMMEKLGKSYDNVKVYMMAKHGLERNAHIAFKKSLEEDYEKPSERMKAYKDYKADMDRLRNDSDYESGKIGFAAWKQKDDAIRRKYSKSYLEFRYDENGGTQDYSGLSALFDGADFEETAADLVRDVESKHFDEAQGLWNATNAATKKILRDSWKAGMMTDDVYDFVRGMYQHYIPLRGWGDTNADQVWNYMGGGKGAFSQTLKEAKGRSSLADDPIAYIENMAESGILINNKNWVKQHLLLLAENHRTSLLTLSKAWYIKTVNAQGNVEWIPASPHITSGMTSKQVENELDVFEKKMERMKQKGDATQKREYLEISYPQTNSEEREHEVRVMKNGEEYVIYINGDPQLAQAMNNTRAHRVREGLENSISKKVLAWIGRKMAAAYTSLSPLFIPSNFFRDTTMTLASTAVREDARYNYLLRKNMLTHWNMYGMIRSYQNGTLREKVRNGKASKTEQMFYDFMMNGGETGFVSSLDVEDLKKKFKNELKDMNRMALNPKKVGHLIMNEIETLNRAIEDSNRFVVYMTSIQYGRSIEEAVNNAKDVTLNFNRKGTGEHGWQTIRNLYLFINPAIQSLQTLGALAKHHPYKFTAVTTAWLASGLLVPMVNYALMSMFGGDDDREKYWQFTKWDRRNNLIMWIPFTHDFVKIPLAQEFRGYYGVGDMIASKLWGGEKAEESWEDYGLDLLGQVVDMLPLDPTGYDGNIAVSLMPNPIRPMFELAFNVDFTGKPLFKDSEYNKYDPNFTKAYAGTPDWLVRISRLVNSVGNDYPDFQQNAVDKFGNPRFNLNNPAVVDHVLSSYLGGAYTMGSQILGVATKALNDAGEVKTADIPLVSKFVANPDDRPVTQKKGDEFWIMMERHDRAANTLSKLKKQAKEDGDYSTLAHFFSTDQYKQYKLDDKEVKKYQEEKKAEAAKESGDDYQPKELTADAVYQLHATPKDDFEDLKMSQIYPEVNGIKKSWEALLDMASSQADSFYEQNADAIQAADEVADIRGQINDIKKDFLSDDGKDAYNAEGMKEIRDLRKKALAVLEKANRVIVSRQKANAEKVK